MIKAQGVSALWTFLFFGQHWGYMNGNMGNILEQSISKKNGIKVDINQLVNY